MAGWGSAQYIACIFRMESCVSELLHPIAPHDLPNFVTPPGDTDVLMVVVGVVLHHVGVMRRVLLRRSSWMKYEF